MAQTRAQRAAKRKHDLEQDRDAPTSKRQRSTGYPTASKEPPVNGKGRKRAPQEPQCHFPVSKRRRVSEQPLEDISADPDERAFRRPILDWIGGGSWRGKHVAANMEHILARKRSSSSLRYKRSDLTSTTPSDQRPREEKSAPYRNPRYKTLLATKNSFMYESDEGIHPESKSNYTALLNSDQTIPKNSLFQDDLFKRTCRSIEDTNEARVLRNITLLLVPSAEILHIEGAGSECLTESINEGWNNSIPLTGRRPQPDYSVGFRREAFSPEQLTKLAPFIGNFLNGDVSFFMATYYMYFPFFACEVKCGAAALDVADCQNAHSMTLAARGVVELFRLVKREGELNRKILSFSVSHDHRSVRIYGYYPVINGKDTKYYRHPIHEFFFTALDGKEKWTTYRFTKNVYDIWMPIHFQRICSAIDQLPSDINFDVQTPSESTGLSQSLRSQLAVSESDGADTESLLLDKDGQLAQATPDTSFSQPAPKRRRSPVKRPRGSVG